MFDKNIELLIYKNNNPYSSKYNNLKYTIYLKFKIRNFKIVIYSNLVNKVIPIKFRPSDNFVLNWIEDYNLFWYIVSPNKLDCLKRGDSNCIYYSKFKINNSSKYNELIDYLRNKLLLGDNSINNKYFINTNLECDNYLLKALSKFL